MSFDSFTQNTQSSANNCIQSMRKCLQTTQNMIGILIKIIQSKNPKSSDLNTLNKYYTVVTNLANKYNNMTIEVFINNDVKPDINTFNIIFKRMAAIANIAEANNANEIVKLMAQLPSLSVNVLSNFNKYIIYGTKEVYAARRAIVKRGQQNIQSNNESIDPLLLNESVFDSIFGAAGSVIKNAWDIITWKVDPSSGDRRDPITRTLMDVSGNLKRLTNYVSSTFIKSNFIGGSTRNFSGLTLKEIGKFFTSNEFLATASGILTVAGLFFVLRKAFRKVKDYLKNVWRSITGQNNRYGYEY